MPEANGGCRDKEGAVFRHRANTLPGVEDGYCCKWWLMIRGKQT